MDANAESAIASASEAAAAASNSIPIDAATGPRGPTTTAATSPHTPATIALDPVQTAHRMNGGRIATSSAVTATAIAASGPNRSAPKMTSIEATDTSMVGVSRMLPRSANSATNASNATAGQSG